VSVKCCIDMSPAFIKGTAAHLPQAEVTFASSIPSKIINEAVDLVRREEQKHRPEAEMDPLRLAQERD